jgi:hypothetical protein
MYNTTTIPTQYNMSAPHPCIFYSLLSSFLLVMPFWAGIMHIIRRYDIENSGHEDESDEAEEEEVEEDEKYMEELKALPLRDLNETDFTELQTKIVRETLEDSDNKSFDIIMTYNKDTMTFWYYTDNLKEVSYDTLETVARKFVIEHDCKKLYIQKAVPVVAAEEGEQAGETPKEGGQGACGTPPTKSVFAKFKKYNTGTKGGLPNFSNDTTNEQTNHFRYKGKLYHYEETLKGKEKEHISNTLLDYAAYKLMIQEKSKEN